MRLHRHPHRIVTIPQLLAMLLCIWLIGSAVYLIQVQAYMNAVIDQALSSVPGYMHTP